MISWWEKVPLWTFQVKWLKVLSKTRKVLNTKGKTKNLWIKTFYHLIVMVYKVRQIGGTQVAIIFYFLWIAMFNANTEALIISENEDKANKVLSRMKGVYNHLPRWMITYFPVCKFTENTLHFGKALKNPNGGERIEGLNSIIKSLPQGGTSTTSFSPNVIAFDEAALLSESEKLFQESYAAVQQSGGQIVMVSNGRGRDNLFYRVWDAITKRQIKGKAMFTGVYEVPGRDIKWYEENRIALSISTGDPNAIKIQFPRTAEEGFISSGRSVFNLKKLEEYERKCATSEPIDRGYLDYDESTKEEIAELMRRRQAARDKDNFTEETILTLEIDQVEMISDIQFIPKIDGPLKIWEYPSDTKVRPLDDNTQKVYSGTRTVMSLDAATGVEGGDMGVIGGYNQRTWQEQFEWYGHIDGYGLGREALKLARYYNRAFIVPEANYGGDSAIAYLKEAGYTNLYHRETKDEDYDKESAKIGYYTSRKGKEHLVELIKRYLGRDIDIKSKETIWELKSFVHKSSGKMEGDTGSRDDRVIKLGLILVGLEYLGIPTEEEEYTVHEKTPADRIYEKIRKKQGRQGKRTAYVSTPYK